MKERLQKLISASGLMSRRAAEEAILSGRVLLNGNTAVPGDKADPDADRILVDGVPLPCGGKKIYVMLNKPRGVVTSLHDEKDRPDVSGLVSDLGARLYPVGRLDMYSEGLLLMTNDGEFANRVMHPSHECRKTYRTWVKGERIDRALARLRAPMEIDGYRIRPAEVELVSEDPGGALLSITIHEGRNRQVRKMCALAGLKVTRLMRTAEGELSLGDLKPGQWRFLTDDEVRTILQES